MNKILFRLCGAMAALLLIGAATGCSSSKNSAKSQSATQPQPSVVVGGKAPGDLDLSSQWTSVQMPCRVSLTKPKNFSLSGRMTMLRDSAINLSMRMLGMEVAAINVTPDSVWVADRFHKIVFTEAISKTLADHEITLDMIQTMMLGLDTKGISPIHIKGDDGRDLVSIKFSDFAETPAGLMASLIEVRTRIKGTDIEMSMAWNTDRAVWNDPATNISFRNNFSGYTRYGFRDLKQMLDNLSSR